MPKLSSIADHEKHALKSRYCDDLEKELLALVQLSEAKPSIPLRCSIAEKHLTSLLCSSSLHTWCEDELGSKGTSMSSCSNSEERIMLCDLLMKLRRL